MSIDVLFVINGLGLGNSTRCHAVIQRLRANGVKIAIVTSNNGLWYFKDRDLVENIHEISPLYYQKSGEDISIFRTLLSIPDFIRIWRSNAQKLNDLLDEYKPKAVVVDSEYTFMPIKSRKIPLIALNNADVVVASMAKFKNAPKSVLPQFYAVEKPDSLFHRSIPNWVLSPSLDPTIKASYSNIHRIGPIVRDNYKPIPFREGIGRVVVMLSGSQFRSPVAFSKRHPFKIDVIGRDKPDDVEEMNGVVYHGRLKDNRRILEEADLVVVNGGFSAVSEAFSMKLPMVVLPIPNHAEQWVNARTIQELGVGLMATVENLENAVNEATKRIDEFRNGYEKLDGIPDGAAQSSDFILKVIGWNA